MKTREKEGRTEIRGKNVFKKSRKKGKTNKTNKKKEKMESGVTYNPLITKRKTFCFGRFTNKIKKIYKLKVIYIISTPPPLHFPKITFTSCAPPLKTQKKNLRIPSLPSSQITQTLKISSSKLNLA
jgi:hypothetical protein